jgi:hypothetical protein
MVTESPITSANYENNLYEEDYYLWLEKTAQILKEGNLQRLDLPNLIEEIEDMGRSEKRAVKSNLIIVLMHLLKYNYQQEKRSNSWRFTIKEHRRRLREEFQTSPSLKRYCLETFGECYQDARDLAATETGLPIDTFPPASPFTFEEALNPDYLPD